MVEQLVILLIFLPRDKKQVWVEFFSSHDDGKVINIITGAGENAHGVFYPGLHQGMCFGPAAKHGIFAVHDAIRVHVDDCIGQGCCLQLRRNAGAEAAKASDNPAAGGRIYFRAQLTSGHADQPVLYQVFGG